MFSLNYADLLRFQVHGAKNYTSYFTCISSKTVFITETQWVLCEAESETEEKEDRNITTEHDRYLAFFGNMLQWTVHLLLQYAEKGEYTYFKDLRLLCFYLKFSEI